MNVWFHNSRSDAVTKYIANRRNKACSEFCFWKIQQFKKCKNKLIIQNTFVGDVIVVFDNP